MLKYIDIVQVLQSLPHVVVYFFAPTSSCFFGKLGKTLMYWNIPHQKQTRVIFLWD